MRKSYRAVYQALPVKGLGRPETTLVVYWAGHAAASVEIGSVRLLAAGNVADRTRTAAEHAAAMIGFGDGDERRWEDRLRLDVLGELRVRLNGDADRDPGVGVDVRRVVRGWMLGTCSCTVTMSAAQNVTAQFNTAPTTSTTPAIPMPQ